MELAARHQRVIETNLRFLAEGRNVLLLVRPASARAISPSP
jgi:hypothetical protein